MRSSSTLRSVPPSRILLVDDNSSGTAARRAVLEQAGCQVAEAICGVEALKLFEANEFDLVVTDYKMEPMNGLEMISELRQRQFAKPIILLSGFAETIGLTAENTGADAVIQKSSNELTVLLRLIRKLLGTPRKPARSQGSRTRKRNAR